jgi:sugar phosphate isomerase/epimerase
VEDIVSVFNFTVCMDIGHLIVCDVDTNKFYNSYCENISIIHLHGVENVRDHLSLDRLPEKRAGEIIEILKKFTKVVSLEVFSYDDLTTSLQFLEKSWNESS